MPIGAHVRIRARDNRVITPSDDQRRVFARIVLRVGDDYGLLAFRAADTHSHALLTCTPAQASQFARRVEIALAKALSVECGFERAYVKPVHDQAHLDSAFWYVLDQSYHHELANDPFHEASNLPDLLGLRLIGRATRERVREHLPRVGQTRLLARLRVTELVVEKPDIAFLTDATAAAAAITLPSRSHEARQALAAAVALADPMLGTGRIATLLGISSRSVQRLRGLEPSQDLVEAIRRQLALRTLLAAEQHG